jgi:hypothetical protein
MARCRHQCGCVVTPGDQVGAGGMAPYQSPRPLCAVWHVLVEPDRRHMVKATGTLVGQASCFHWNTTTALLQHSVIFPLPAQAAMELEAAGDSFGRWGMLVGHIGTHM